jgi:hypothetical protein
MAAFQCSRIAFATMLGAGIWSRAVPELSVTANALGNAAPKRARREPHRATLP